MLAENRVQLCDRQFDKTIQKARLGEPCRAAGRDTPAPGGSMRAQRAGRLEGPASRRPAGPMAERECGTGTVTDSQAYIVTAARRRRNKTMNAEQPTRRYSGVTWHAKKWLAKLRHNGKDLNLGHYEDPEDAAWVADFARYMCFGLNPVNWHHNTKKPNFPPRISWSIPRVVILKRLLSAQTISVEVLERRLAEYDSLIEHNVRP